MKKSMLALLFAVVLLVCAALPVSAAEHELVTKGKQVAADAAKMTFPTDGSECSATCPVCGTNATWLPLTPEVVEAGFTTAEANTHYYLTGSAESATAKITMFNSSTYTSCVHLNGKDITSTGAVAIEGKAGKLNIMGSGTVKGAGVADEYSSPATVVMANKGSVNLYGGTYEKYDTSAATNTAGIGWGGGTIAVYDGATVKAGTSGSAVYIDSSLGVANATLNVYGGMIVGGNASTVNTKVVADDVERKLTINMYAGIIKNGNGTNGGNFNIQKNVTFNMSGGEVTGGTATNGGNVCVEEGGTFNMSGGKLTGGVSTGKTLSNGVGDGGGNVYLYKSAVMNMYDGAISGGKANISGGNVHIGQSAEFNMYDGTITLGTANLSSTNYLTGGGNVFVSRSAKFNMSDGTISYGSANKGGNIGTTRSATLNLYGGIIEYGTSKADGGNIFSNSYSASNRVTINLKNVIIRNGTTTTTSGYGGNLGLTVADLNIGAGTLISDGTAAKRGGNIRLNNGTIVMTGGKITNGTASDSGYDEIHLECTSSSSKSVMYMLGGTIESKELEDGSIRVNDNSEFYLGGNATIVNNNSDNYEIRIYKSSDGTTGKLFVCNGWSGSATVHDSAISWSAGATISTDKIQVVTLDENRNKTAGGRFTGKLLHIATGSILMSSGDANGTVVAGGMAVVDKDGKVTMTNDPLTLWATGEYAFIRMFSNYTVDVTGKNLWIDLNGLTLTVTGSGSVNVLDTSGDAFKTPTGSVAVVEGITIPRNVDAPNGNRYLAVEKSGKLTFHRLDIRVSSVSLRPSAAGIYYRATYNCDETLAAMVNTYGVVLSVYGMPGVDFKTSDLKCAYTVSAEQFKSGVIANSGSVFGIMKDTREADLNRQCGEVKIYANPYIQIGTDYYMGDDENAGKTVKDESFDGIALSLHDVMDALEEKYEELSVTTRRSVDKFYQTWQSKGMGTWKYENIGTEINKFDNSDLQFTEGTTKARCPACDAIVEWTAITQADYGTNGIGTATNGTHYYLTEDVTYTGDDAGFIANPTDKNEKACLHLNGHNLTATAHAAIYTPYAHAGILNVMGDGVVSGKRNGTGTTVYLSSKNEAGRINLYGGTYEASSGSAVVALINGGSIHVYNGAWVKGNGSAVYMDKAGNAKTTFAVHGGKITGGDVAVAVDAGTKARTFVIDGKAYVEELVVRNANVAVEISGAPVIDCVSLKSGGKLTVGTLEEGAQIAVSTNKVFTQTLENAADYLKYFKAWNTPDSITVTDAGELYYSINYEYYMTPYQYDVKEKAIADGKIHYYFMAAKGMIMDPTNGGDRDKWGDSCLVVFPNGETMLIDAGYAIQAPVIIGSLKRMGVTTLDYLVITHPHNDHIGGAFSSSSTFLDEIIVEQVYYQDLQYGSSWDGVLESKCDARSIPYTALWKDDVLTFGEGDKAVTMTMLWPGESDVDKTIDATTNKHSMVFRFDYGEHSSLFTADIYDYTDKKLLAMYTEGELEADLMKVPHHGLGTNTSSVALLQAVTPEIAVATGSFDISSTLTKRYADIGATLLEDRFHGYIHIASGTDGVMTTETEQ